EQEGTRKEAQAGRRQPKDELWRRGMEGPQRGRRQDQPADQEQEFRGRYQSSAGEEPKTWYRQRRRVSWERRQHGREVSKAAQGPRGWPWHERQGQEMRPHQNRILIHSIFLPIFFFSSNSVFLPTKRSIRD